MIPEVTFIIININNMRRQGELSPVVESDFIILSPGDEVGLNVIVIIGLWLLDDSSSLVAQLTSLAPLSLQFWSLHTTTGCSHCGLDLDHSY